MEENFDCTKIPIKEFNKYNTNLNFFPNISKSLIKLIELTTITEGYTGSYSNTVFHSYKDFIKSNNKCKFPECKQIVTLNNTRDSYFLFFNYLLGMSNTENVTSKNILKLKQGQINYFSSHFDYSDKSKQEKGPYSIFVLKGSIPKDFVIESLSEICRNTYSFDPENLNHNLESYLSKSKTLPVKYQNL